MRELIDVVAKVAPAPATVLIQGESGTGKELMARLIHRWSPRQDKPFVAVNLASIPAELAESLLFGHEKGAFTGAVRTATGKFEQAHGGTLFLDEVGDLPLPLQSKLLRAIQEREIERVGSERPIPIDVRLVAATHVDLLAAAQAGRFREDLYYRLNVIPLRVPPLRERREEIPDLAQFFVRKFAARARREVPVFSDAATERLIAYDWPGNVRELENVVERLVTVCERPVFDESDLPLEIRGALGSFLPIDDTTGGPSDLQKACDTFERNYIARALERSGWNKALCARQLGISYATMKNKIARYGLSEPSSRFPSRITVRRPITIETEVDSAIDKLVNSPTSSAGSPQSSPSAPGSPGSPGSAGPIDHRGWRGRR
jgi:two-component system response regulator HydG